MGTEPRVESDVMEHFLPKEGSYLILCSDGLYNFLSEEELLEVLYGEKGDYDEDDYEAELAYKTDELVNIANANGGGDNITIILIKVL